MFSQNLFWDFESGVKLDQIPFPEKFLKKFRFLIFKIFNFWQNSKAIVSKFVPLFNKFYFKTSILVQKLKTNVEIHSIYVTFKGKSLSLNREKILIFVPKPRPLI